jgi:hypothetical protein
VERIHGDILGSFEHGLEFEGNCVQKVVGVDACAGIELPHLAFSYN